MASSAMAKKPFSTNSAKTTTISRINILSSVYRSICRHGPDGSAHRRPAPLAADARTRTVPRLK